MLQQKIKNKTMKIQIAYYHVAVKLLKGKEINAEYFIFQSIVK